MGVGRKEEEEERGRKKKVEKLFVEGRIICEPEIIAHRILAQLGNIEPALRRLSLVAPFSQPKLQYAIGVSTAFHSFIDS